MAKTPEKPQQQMQAIQPVQADGADAEYGIEQLLNADEEELSKVKEHSSYRFTQDQLDHHADRVDEPEKSV